MYVYTYIILIINTFTNTINAGMLWYAGSVILELRLASPSRQRQPKTRNDVIKNRRSAPVFQWAFAKKIILTVTV